jgi:O-antigen ligase
LQTEDTSSGREKLARSALITVLSLVPVFAIIRYRWPQVLLPVAAVPSIALVIGMVDGRAAFAAGRERFRNPLTILCGAFLCWVVASVIWSPDRSASAIMSAKIALGIVATILIAIAASTLDRQRLAVTLCTALASIVTIITALTDGVLHHAAGCCLYTVQPELSAAAVFISQFIPICVGWSVLMKRPWMAAAMFALAGCAVALSNSGASAFAFLAGCLTLAVGFRYPRLAITFPLVIMLFGFATALYLGELRLPSPAYASDILGSFHVPERVEIWAYYADLFWRRPWMGYGIGTEQFLADRAALTSIPLPPNAHLHPHNVPLQIFVELGVIGATLFVLALISVTARLGRNASFRTAVAVAPAAVFATAGLFNFGIWELWRVSGTILASICSFQLLRQLPPSADINQSENIFAA